MNTFKFFLLTFQLIVLTLANDEPVATFELCDLSQEKYNGYCMNNGICYNLINKGTIDQRIFCSCPTEYTGKRCEDRLLRPTFMPYLKKDLKPVASARSIKSSDFCSSIDCKSGEICKYFDSNMYKCPDETMNCEPYRKSSKIPICVEKNKNDVCMESLKMGNCTTYKQRFYFDAVDKTCKKFYYTGCNGNQNNFLTHKECSSTCSRSTINFAPRKILSKTTSSHLHSEKRLNRCEFQCSLNCPFGYRLNYRTNCPKCECQALEMTECGVPCFTPGTKKCAFAMRANSRPNCQCNPYYDGAYCHLYTKSANFTVELDKPLEINDSIRSEIKVNLRESLSKLLQVGKKSVVVNEVANDHLKKVMIKFNVKAEDFSTPNEFENLVDSIKSSLSGYAVVSVGNVTYTLSQSN